MLDAFLKFLSKMGKTVGKTLTTKKGLTELGKGILKRTATGALFDAFAQGQNGNQPERSQAEPIGEPQRPMSQDMGILGFLGGGDSSQITPQTIAKPTVIPSQYQQFIRQPGMQYVPGPEGSVIGGQGEVTPGYDMQSPQSKIPPAYQNIAQVNQQNPQAGFIRGFTENLLGIPQTPALQEASTGRKTAYYAGGLIPKIVMSKLGQPSSAEAAGQQQQLEKRPTPEYKKDLREAVIRLGKPNLSETDKIMIYQQLVTVYPERSAEIKRVFFPQSGDNFDDLLKEIITGNLYGR